MCGEKRMLDPSCGEILYAEKSLNLTIFGSGI